MKKKNNTSWGTVAKWYEEHLANDDTYHSKVILPNLTRMMDLKKDHVVAEIACGEGFFTRHIGKLVKEVYGVDIAPELIDLAQSKKKELGIKNVIYKVSNASETGLPANSFSKAIIVLALQNIKDLNGAITEMARILKSDGNAYIVLNHPAFRIAGQSSWQYDESKNVQYRRIDSYMSEESSEIDMSPGSKNKNNKTISFHRPMQIYFKAFAKNNLSVTKLEEWISHRKSQKGKRQSAEDRARKEFPLFMCIELRKTN